MTLFAAEFYLLQPVWFILIAVLWIGYLVLEGFDYGVAMLLPFLGRNDRERRVMVNTIGPLWDGNEVWLLTAGGATFAAFPAWYATLFSGLYLPLFLVLVGLIIRGVAFEYRSKHPETSWRNTFDWMACIGSFLTALVLGVGFANFIIGLPVTMAKGSKHLFVIGDGNAPYFFQLFSPFALLGGVVLVVLFLFHGSLFLMLKTKGEIRDRAKAFANTLGMVAIGGGAVYLLCQNVFYQNTVAPILGWLLLVLAAAGLVMAWYCAKIDKEGWAFIGTTLATLFVAVGIFLRMFPNLGFSNVPDAAQQLNMTTAAASNLTLNIMLGAAIVFVPIVLAYQGWSLWVFSKRISVKNIPDEVATA